VGDSYGLDVERRRREVSAFHGVPDFVFRPLDVPKGKGSQREVGDFLLWVGDVVAIVSHKSREPAAAASETQARRRAWFEKKIADGYSQVRGVARKLQTAAADEIVLESERGVRVPWDATRVTGLVGVVVIDAPAPDDDYGPPVMLDGVPTIAMLADDWDLLSELLPSTWSMITYIARRATWVPRCPIGSELDTLALIIEHENVGTPIAIPPGGLPKDHFEQVRAAHPEWFLGGDPDDRFSFVVDAMIEGAADLDPDHSDATEPLAYMQITEFLDRIPLLTRVNLGREIIDRCQRIGREGGRSSFRVALDHGMFVFMTDDRERKDRASWLRSLTAARHSQALDAGAPRDLMTLGVATQPLPSPDRGRAHEYVLIQGGIRSDPEFRASRDDLFGAQDMEPLVERWKRAES
jgi:hypothetical protein